MNAFFILWRKLPMIGGAAEYQPEDEHISTTSRSVGLTQKASVKVIAENFDQSCCSLCKRELGAGHYQSIGFACDKNFWYLLSHRKLMKERKTRHLPLSRYYPTSLLPECGLPCQKLRLEKSIHESHL